VQKEAERKIKYKSLCIEVQGMWNLKFKIMSVITGITGIVTSLQKTAILGISHIIRRVLQSEH